MSTDSYVHRRAEGAPGGPLVFAFHGTGGDEHQLVDLARELVPGATIVSPRGDVSEFGAARFFRRTGEGVYDMDDLARATAKMARFVQAHVAAENPSRVLAFGHSNGANILATVLFAHPDLFDAVVLMHPLIPFHPAIAGSLAGRPILITAGQRDPICPPNLTHRLEAWLKEAGAAVTTHWHPGGHELRPDEIAATRSHFAAAVSGRNPVMTEASVTVEHEDYGSKGRYFVRAPGGAVAEMTFSKVGESRIIIDHTEVPDAFRGQGIGLMLVTRAVEDARAGGKSIIPLCPFAREQFRRHHEWADVLNG